MAHEWIKTDAVNENGAALFRCSTCGLYSTNKYDVRPCDPGLWVDRFVIIDGVAREMPGLFEEAAPDEAEGHSFAPEPPERAIVPPIGADVEELRLLKTVIKKLSGGRWKLVSEIELELPVTRSLSSIFDAVRKYMPKDATLELKEPKGGGLALRIVRHRPKKEAAESPPPP